jgi:RNA polymerase sigma-70 factor (sigma-E family)
VQATGAQVITFDEFVRARLPHLLRLGRALTGDEQRGADLVQDALIRVLPKWDRISSADPEGYVRRVMVNRNISVWRSLRRERLAAEPPERGVEDRVRDQALWEALAQLPPRQRTVITLRYLSDQTEAQTAALMGCSLGTVKSQASAAMRKLHDLLDDREEDR